MQDTQCEIKSPHGAPLKTARTTSSSMMFECKTQPLIHSLGDTHLTVIHRQKVNPLRFSPHYS
jgi:hypothetical protein